MRSHEAVTQGAGHTGQLAFLWQQQGDLGQRLAGQLHQFDQRGRQLGGGRVIGVLGAPGIDGGLLLLDGAGAFYCQGQAGPAGHGVGAGAQVFELVARDCRYQVPDRVVVGVGGITLEQRRQLRALLGGSQGLAIGFEHRGMHAAGTDLLIFRQLVEARQARVAQGGQGQLRLVAAHGQFCRQGAGEDLLGRFELLQWHLLEDARGAGIVLLLVGQVGGAQAQQCSLLRRLAGGGLFKQLLDAGIRCARQFAEARRGRAGAGCQQGGEAKGCEQPQASDHVRVLLLDQINWQLYPSAGRGAILLALILQYRSWSAGLRQS
ncbi:hypothetical protein D3C81_975120 [compost metagenome]